MNDNTEYTNNTSDNGGPNFDFEKFNIGIDDLKKEASNADLKRTSIAHDEILNQLMNHIKKVDFRKLAELKDTKEGLKRKHYLICIIEEIIKIATDKDWGMCKQNGYLYLYNSAYWDLLDMEQLQSFLGNAAEKMGVDKFDAQYYNFRDQLLKQFQAQAVLPKPDHSKGITMINLTNGTFEISSERRQLREFRKVDFLTYQLPFEYNKDAQAPKFKEYLDQVLPDKDTQNVLSEFLGSIFIPSSVLKLEKALLLYGTGANGKSVFFEIVNALLGGDKNVSNYSLQNLTDESGYYRAKLANKLVNYASEINGKMETSIFKQLVSGEPVSARLPYGEPFNLSVYGKLMFNCNELPKDAEPNHAYYRRLSIIEFKVTIPENEQNKELSKIIINEELSGVFNWVLEGLERLLKQKKFSESLEIQNALTHYKTQSDNVLLFLSEEEYVKSINEYLALSELYNSFRLYCELNGCRPLASKNFSERLRSLGYVVERKSYGMAVYIKKEIIKRF